MVQCWSNSHTVTVCGKLCHLFNVYMSVCVCKGCLRRRTVNSINKWCTHMKTFCIREINTSRSESGCQGLERHRKLQQADIHKGHAVTQPPSQTAATTQPASWEQHSHSDWSAGLSGNLSWDTYKRRLCVCELKEGRRAFFIKRIWDLRRIWEGSGAEYNYNTEREESEYVSCHKYVFLCMKEVYFHISFGDFYLQNIWRFKDFICKNRIYFKNKERLMQQFYR